MRNGKVYRKRGKSLLAVILTIAMLFSVFPLSVQAADLQGTTSHTSHPEGYPNHDTSDYPSFDEEGYAQLRKSAAWDDVDKINATITMDAYGQGISGQGADAVIIIDRSGSMGLNQNPGRDKLAIAAANQFAEKMLGEHANGSANTNEIAVVGFGTSIYSSGTFYGATAAGRTGVKREIDAQVSMNEATNYKIPLAEAKRLLDARRVQGRPQYVIFLTDGEPTNVNEPAFDDPNLNGVAEAAAIRNAGIDLYCIGFAIGKAGDERYDHLYKLASDNPAGGKFCYDATEDAASIQKAYDDIFNQLKKAGTSAEVVDTLDEKFDLDPTRSIKIDGAAVSAGPNTYTLSNNNRTITWHLGDLIEVPGNTIEIPIRLKDQYHAVEGLYPTNSGDAYMTYLNFKDTPVACRQNVKSPVLAKPYALIEKVYYEVDDEGYALDYTGARLLNPTHFDLYQNQLKTIADQCDADNSPYISVADDYIDVANGRYKFAENARNNSDPSNTKVVSVTIASNAETYQIFYGYRQLRTEGATLNKVYTPSVPSHITERASFTYQEAGQSTTTHWAGSGDTYTMPSVQEDRVYKIHEEPLKGYTPVDDFYILYDGSKLVYVDEDGNPETPPSTIQMNGMNITVQNVQDLDQTDETFYVVKYYKDKKLVDADTITRKKEVWTNAAEIPVDAADVNIVNKYYGYKCVSPASVPTSVPRETVIEVYYEEDHGQTEKREYTVEYFWNNEYRETVKYESEEWVGKSTITLQDFKDYSASGYQLERTNPANLTPGTTELSNNAKIQAYYTVDSQTQPIDYVIQYYKNGTLVIEDVQPLSKDVWYLLNTASVYKAEIDYNKYPDMVVDHIEFDGKTVTKYPITITRGAANEIKVYYVEDLSVLTELTYTINYYQYADHVTPDAQVVKTVTVPKEVQSIMVQKSDVEYTRYANQMVDETASDTVPMSVVDGDVIDIYYVKDTTKLKEGSYEIHYYKEGTYVEKTIVKKVVWAGDEKITVEKSDFETEKYAGYLPLADADVSPGYGEKVDFGHVVTANYWPDTSVKDNSFTFKYNIYYGTEDDGFSLLRTEDVTVGPLWVGTEEISLTRQSDGSYLDEIGNTAVYAEIPHPTTGGKLGILTDTDPLKVKRGGTINVYYEYLLMIDIPLTGTVKVTSGRVKPNDFAGVITGTCTDSSLPITMDGTVSSTGVITFTVIGGVEANTVLGKELEFVIRQDPEQSSATGSYTWDTSVYTVKLRLSKSASGEISVTILSGASIVFTNRPK